MTQSRQPKRLEPGAALALVAGVALVLLALLLRPLSGTAWPTDASGWFGPAAGGAIHLDQPAR
jgi:hypothetical protein